MIVYPEPTRAKLSPASSSYAEQPRWTYDQHCAQAALRIGKVMNEGAMSMSKMTSQNTITSCHKQARKKHSFLAFD